MQFSNEQFYGNEMIPAPDVADRTLKDIPGYDSSEIPNTTRDYLRPRPPVVLLDTSDLSVQEQKKDESHSIYNPEEAKVVNTIVNDLLASGLQHSHIAVVSPYKAQVELLRSKRQENSIQIDTIDGFQGQEEDVVVMSLVRSNKAGSIGFLSDQRRLNVSLTRARRKLIIIGDFSTLTNFELFESLFDYIKEEGRVINLTKTPISDR
jgi:superfamily I DNA and/or RNA helicase